MKPQIVGIINLTPDSFSDGGTYDDHQAVLCSIESMLPFVDIIEFGAESTRPGSFLQNENSKASLIDDVTEWERYQKFDIIKLIRFCVNHNVVVSIDSRHVSNIARLVDHGIAIVNDQSCGYQHMELMARDYLHLKFVLMHHLVLPSDRDVVIVGDNNQVIQQITKWWREKIAICQASGIDGSRLILDPGVGFGKNQEHACFLVNNMHLLVAAMPGMALMLGHSRKGFLRGFDIDQSLLAEVKDPVSLLDIKSALIAAVTYPYVAYFRVHNPRAISQILKNITTLCS